MGTDVGAGFSRPARGVTRREFLASSGASLVALTAQAEQVIDIHQHLGYSGRADRDFLAHQERMGATLTILLPAGRDASRPSTHAGVANGLQARALGTDDCLRFAKAYPQAYRFGANDVPDLDGAIAEIERYVKQGAVLIAEQKFGVECDAPEMQRIYELARSARVPVLMHWQFKMYNYGFERFHTMLEKYPTVNFIGHAQTWWGNISGSFVDQTVMYPPGPVARGGLTDRYLSDYPNMYGDLSAGSGLNALTRDEAFTRDFLARHQDKLLFGSDCSDSDGAGAGCLGARILAAVRRLAPTKHMERKILHDNAKTLFRL